MSDPQDFPLLLVGRPLDLDPEALESLEHNLDWLALAFITHPVAEDHPRERALCRLLEYLVRRAVECGEQAYYAYDPEECRRASSQAQVAIDALSKAVDFLAEETDTNSE